MPAPRLPWFKLWPEAMRHEKVALLSDGVFRTWIVTLGQASEQATRWRFGSVQHAATVTGRPAKHIRELVTAELLDLSETGEVWVHNWRKWQERYASDFSPRTHDEHSVKAPSRLRDDSANAVPPSPSPWTPALSPRRGESETGDTEGDGRTTPLPPPAEGEYPPGPPQAGGAASSRNGGGDRHTNGHQERRATRRDKPVLNGRDGWMGCPAGCPANHGGPLAAKFLGEDWLATPAENRPPWPEFLARHGRPDLADVPALQPVTQEV
jgi:hypothetical protein